MSPLALRVALLLPLAACATTSQPRIEARARALLEAGELAPAYGAYADALCEEPARVDLALAYVELWSRLGNPGRADARLAECKLTPVTLHLILGLAAAVISDHGGAARELDLAEQAATSADRAGIAQRRGLVALRAGDPRAAVTHLERAASLAPEHVETRLALAQAHIEAGEHGASVEVLRGLLTLGPSSADLERARRIGRAAVRKSQPQLAPEHEATVQTLLGDLERGAIGEEHSTRARDLLAATRHPRVLAAAGMLALRQQDPAGGTLLLDEAAKVSPLDPDPLRALGMAAFAAERLSAAITPLREAAHRDPLDVSVHVVLAQVATKLGQSEIALEAYRTLTALEPREPEYFLWVARLSRKLGDVAGARRAAEQGRVIQNDNIPLLLERASIEAQLAITAVSEPERDAAVRRTRAAVAELLAVAPNHPGAASIIESVDGRATQN